MNYWLKMIGTAESPWTEPYTRTYVDSVHNPRRVRRGDFMILYAVGGALCVFAITRVTSDVYDSGEQRWPHRLNIEYEVNLPVSSGVHIDEVSTPERNLRLALRRMSILELTPNEYENAAIRLGQVAASLQTGSNAQ